MDDGRKRTNQLSEAIQGPPGFPGGRRAGG